MSRHYKRRTDRIPTRKQLEYWESMKGQKGSDAMKEKCRKAALDYHAKGMTEEHKSNLSLALTRLIKKEDSAITLEHLRRRMKKRLGDKCAICGWMEASCDAHHIISLLDGGNNEIKNIIVLCPNHHRLADRGKITISFLLKLKQLENE